MYNFQLNLYSSGSKIGSFNFPNSFNNILVDIHSTRQGSSNRHVNLINVNQMGKFFPDTSYAKESTFYMSTRYNREIDSKFSFSNPKGLLTGLSSIGSHIAYDSNIRLSYYDTKIAELTRLYRTNKISDGTYAMLRYHAQKATKLQLSVVGQNLSEFPPLGKPLNAQRATAESIANGNKKLSPNAFNTRKVTNKSAKVLRGMGTGILFVSAAQSVYSVIKANNKGQAFAGESMGWGASLVGGELGMQAGASIGGAIGVCFGGTGYAPGAAFGGFIGGIAGGIGGYIWGMDTMNDYFDTRDRDYQHHFKGFSGGSSGGGGTGGGW